MKNNLKMIAFNRYVDNEQSKAHKKKEKRKEYISEFLT